MIAPLILLAIFSSPSRDPGDGASFVARVGRCSGTVGLPLFEPSEMLREKGIIRS
jgi:predicted house-cleaning NTP pyrophosphatase (Maf/HAM1 superfamily)